MVFTSKTPKHRFFKHTKNLQLNIYGILFFFFEFCEFEFWYNLCIHIFFLILEIEDKEAWYRLNCSDSRSIRYFFCCFSSSAIFLFLDFLFELCNFPNMTQSP